MKKSDVNQIKIKLKKYEICNYDKINSRGVEMRIH